MFSFSKRTKRRRVTENVNAILKSIESTPRAGSFSSPLSSTSLHQQNDTTCNVTSPKDIEPNTENTVECSEVNVNLVEPGLIESDCQNHQGNSTTIGFKDKLATWSIENNVTQVATSQLLKLIREEFSVEVPLDARSLLKTPRNVEYLDIGEGKFFYFGIEQQVKSKINSGLKVLSTKIFREFSLQFDKYVTISVGVDGLPVAKSSNKQLWHILGIVDQSFDRSPFVIGLFFGTTKTSSLDIFLEKFVLECKHLEDVGIQYGNINYSFRISNFICDAPARSFLKRCKSHNSYDGCERCVQEGVFLGRVIFTNLNSNLRSDDSYRNQSDSDHHVGVSPLLSLTLNLVDQFPLDYMHLVCLGVVRKLMHTWIKGPLKTRLLPRNINRISIQLVDLQRQIPLEFSRKSRSLRELDHFKATEFRLFLLYTGPVVMQHFLEPSIYKNFLQLQCSLYILLSDFADNVQWNEYSKKLLICFVNGVQRIYGSEFLSYNMHSLIHLADDALKNGNLDNISAFPFENYMQTLKRFIRSKSGHLNQIVNRISELNNLSTINRSNLTLVKRNLFVNYSQGNNCFLTIDFKVIIIVRIESADSGDNNTIFYKKFLCTSPLEHYPMDSSLFHIYTVQKLSRELTCRKEYLLRKCVLLPHSGKGDIFTSIPML
jgi:hypothetical protein